MIYDRGSLGTGLTGDNTYVPAVVSKKQGRDSYRRPGKWFFSQLAFQRLKSLLQVAVPDVHVLHSGVPR